MRLPTLLEPGRRVRLNGSSRVGSSGQAATHRPSRVLVGPDEMSVGDCVVSFALPAQLEVVDDDHELIVAVDWVPDDDGVASHAAVTEVYLRMDRGVRAESLREISLPDALDEILSSVTATRKILETYDADETEPDLREAPIPAGRSTAPGRATRVPQRGVYLVVGESPRYVRAERTEEAVDPRVLAEFKRRAVGPTVRLRDPDVLERVAQAHREAAPGERIRAVQRLGYSVSHAKRLVREAREARLLEHSSRSKRS